MTEFIKNKKANILIFLFLICLIVPFFCKQEPSEQKQSEETENMRDINLVLKTHVQEVMAIPGVVGIYVGATADNKPCLKVMVIKETEEIKKRIPKKLEGYPVFIDVTGEIKPMK